MLVPFLMFETSKIEETAFIDIFTTLITWKVARGDIFKRLGVYLGAPKHCKKLECAVREASQKNPKCKP